MATIGRSRKFIFNVFWCVFLLFGWFFYWVRFGGGRFFIFEFCCLFSFADGFGLWCGRGLLFCAFRLRFCHVNLQRSSLFLRFHLALPFIRNKRRIQCTRLLNSTQSSRQSLRSSVSTAIRLFFIFLITGIFLRFWLIFAWRSWVLLLFTWLATTAVTLLVLLVISFVLNTK